MKVGVVGNGFVGRAMTLLRPGVDVLVWDIDPNKCEPFNLTFEQFVNDVELIFVAVPTPMNPDGTCHLNIVRSVVNKIKELDYEKHIVLRSTVPPGTCDSMDVSFMPEFLTEKNWAHDFKNCEQWIIGTDNTLIYNKIKTIFSQAKSSDSVVNDNIIQTTPAEAEMIKYVKNCYLATKVSFFNEIYNTCQAANINFENVRSVACEDSRIGTGHSTVPGHDGKMGYGGTCFPKDMNALTKFMEQHNVVSHVLSGAVIRNETIDRVEKDWLSDTGRAAI